MFPLLFRGDLCSIGDENEQSSGATERLTRSPRACLKVDFSEAEPSRLPTPARSCDSPTRAVAKLATGFPARSHEAKGQHPGGVKRKLARLREEYAFPMVTRTESALRSRRRHRRAGPSSSPVTKQRESQHLMRRRYGRDAWNRARSAESGPR